jgi:hypothetical protein
MRYGLAGLLILMILVYFAPRFYATCIAEGSHAEAGFWAWLASGFYGPT